MLAKFDIVNLIRDVNTDDSFYYFQIAANLAEGKFSTFDGGITRTNGYHPLWMLMITPFYWFFDRETALFAIKAFEIMLVAGAVALIAVAARLAKLPWILLFALLPALYQHRALFWGLEAAAALFMLGLLFLALCLYAKSPRWWTCFFLAAIAFALPWSRLEFVVISLTTTTALCLVEWSLQDNQPGESVRIRIHSMRRTLVPLFGAVSGIAAYFIYNGVAFGGIVPVSGATKLWWSQRLWDEEGGYNLAQNFREALDVRFFHPEPMMIALGICGCALLVWWSARLYRSRTDRLFLVFLVGASGIATAHLVKFAESVLSVHPYYMERHSWYFVPLYSISALAIPIGCYVAIHFINRFISAKSRLTSRVLSLAVISAGLVILFAKSDFQKPFQNIDHISKTSQVIGFEGWAVRAYSGLQVMNIALSDDSVVGMRNSGIIGYFSHFSVVNLDGLVNSYEYLHAQQVGNAAHLHSKSGLTHRVNTHIDEKRDRLPNTIFEGVQEPDPHKEGRMWEFRLWSENPTTSLSDELDNDTWFYEKIKPYLRYESDRIGIFVNDGLVQFFAEDCEPDRIREEVFVFSWLASESNSVSYIWRNPSRNNLGFCVGVLELPNEADPPIGIEAMTMNEYLARLTRNVRSVFDVYMDKRGNSIVYAKEQCADGDVAPTFFLHITPVDSGDLPNHRKQYDFDNLDFRFEEYGFMRGGSCFIIRDLPQYDFAAIRTGQYTPEEGRLWEGEIRLDE